MRFAKNTQRDTSKVLRLPRKMTIDTSKVLRLPRKTATHLLKTSQKYCACHAKRLLTRCRTRLDVTKCHACHAKRSNDTLETSTSAELPIGTAIRSSYERVRTVAGGCGRLRPQTQRRANTPSTPRPPEWNGNPCYAFGKSLDLEQLPLSPLLQLKDQETTPHRPPIGHIASTAPASWNLGPQKWQEPKTPTTMFGLSKLSELKTFSKFKIDLLGVRKLNRHRGHYSLFSATSRWIWIRSKLDGCTL